MEKQEVKAVFDEFNHLYNFDSYNELKSGHINDTFLIKTDGDENYVLQRINHRVFKDVPGLINNKVSISNHLKNKLSHLPKEEIKKKVLQFVKEKKSDNYYFKKGNDFWNLMIFIEDSFTYEIVKDEKIAYEGGKLSGEFLNLTSDFEDSKLIEVIPNFHNMSYRYKQYAYAVQSATLPRLNKAKEYTSIVAKLKEEMHILQDLKDQGEIPIRVTHNDTKISNTLFDENKNGICVIDTDTVMPGIVHYDFGDAIRTICNTAAEDEQDLSKVEFNLPFYKAYLKGFLEKTGESLSLLEKKHLALGAKTMIFIMALRFLTDYLNNDVYYKINYPEHNLDRAKNQFKLIESFTEKMD